MSQDLSPGALLRRLAEPEPPMVIDVRKRAAFDAEPLTIPGALRRDPSHLADWAGALPPGAGLVVYCVHGHEVSHGVRDALRRHGFAVELLAGGLEGWKAAGGALAAAAEDRA